MRRISGKYQIILFLFFLVIILLMIIIVDKNRSIQQQPIPIPVVQKYINNSFPIEMEIKELNIPQNLPMANVAYKEIDNNLSKTIAENLSFEGEMKSVNDVREGKKNYWNDEKSSLWITPKTHSVRYSLNNLPEGVSLLSVTQAALEASAIDFFSKKLLIPEEYLKVSSVKYYQTEGFASEAAFIETSKENATAIQINFTPTTFDYEITKSIPFLPANYIIITNNNQIYKAEATYYDKVELSKVSYKLKNLEEIKLDLPNASVQSVTNVYSTLKDLADKIKKIKVNKINVKYLVDTNYSKTIQPVFVLEGNIEIEGYGNNRTQLILPALKQP